MAVIHGAGGTGKTELAKAFARWLRDSGGLDRRNFVFFKSFELGIATFGLKRVLSDIGLELRGSDFARVAQRRSGQSWFWRRSPSTARS